MCFQLGICTFEFLLLFILLHLKTKDLVKEGGESEFFLLALSDCPCQKLGSTGRSLEAWTRGPSNVR